MKYHIIASDAGPYIGAMHSMCATHHGTVSASDPIEAIERLHETLERECGILGVMSTSWSYVVQSESEGHSSHYRVTGSAGRGYRPVQCE